MPVLLSLLAVSAGITGTVAFATLAAHELVQDLTLFSKQPFDFIVAGKQKSGATGQRRRPFGLLPERENGRRLSSMAWVRPRKEEFDVWERLGIKGGWNWDGLLPYMMKSSNVSLGNSSAFPGSQHPSGFDPSVEGRNGPIQVGYDNTFSGVVSPWVESFVKVGAVPDQDPDNGNNIGVFNGAHSVDDKTGNRSSATSGYLVPNLNRPNLLVLTGAMVSQVIFSTKTAPLKASGVQYTVNGTTYTATAAREVIISAGTVQTPQILEFS